MIKSKRINYSHYQKTTEKDVVGCLAEKYFKLNIWEKAIGLGPDKQGSKGSLKACGLGLT